MGDNETDEERRLIEAARKVKAAWRAFAKISIPGYNDLKQRARQEERRAKDAMDRGHLDAAIKHLQNAKRLNDEADALDKAAKTPAGQIALQKAHDAWVKAEKEYEKALHEFMEND